MNGPSVTLAARTVLADAGAASWWPPSSRPVAPHFSYQAPISAYHAPDSGVPWAGSAGVSRSSSTYFTMSSSFPDRAPVAAPRSPHSTNGAPADPTRAGRKFPAGETGGQRELARRGWDSAPARPGSGFVSFAGRSAGQPAWFWIRAPRSGRAAWTFLDAPPRTDLYAFTIIGRLDAWARASVIDSRA